MELTDWVRIMFFALPKEQRAQILNDYFEWATGYANYVIEELGEIDLIATEETARDLIIPEIQSALMDGEDETIVTIPAQIKLGGEKINIEAQLHIKIYFEPIDEHALTINIKPKVLKIRTI